MNRIEKQFTLNEPPSKGITALAYSDDGGKVWRWRSNNQVVPLGAVKSYDIPADLDAQKKAYDLELHNFLSEYRELHKNGPSDEERAEARAAHGPGVKLVNVITGREWVT